MEKRTPHYSLEQIKELLSKHAISFEDNEFKRFGLDEQAFKEILSKLTNADYHKSINCADNPYLWRDVYRPVINKELLDMPDDRYYQELLAQGIDNPFYKPKKSTQVKFYILLAIIEKQLTLLRFQYLCRYNR